MRIIINESYINTRARIGERAPFVGFVLLLAAMVLMFALPEWLWASMILVWIGFVVSLIGGYLGDRYVGALAHYKTVPKAFKGLSNHYILLIHHTLVPFVLLGPEGVWVITVKSQGGNITYQNGKWRHREKLGILRRFAGQEALGHPDRMAQAEAADFRRFLQKQLPAGIEVSVRPLLLFINPNVHLDVDDAPVPALLLTQAKRWMRKQGHAPKLSEDVLQHLRRILEIGE